MSADRETVRVFGEQGHYTTIYDPVFDEVMPRCPGNAFKVLMFIIRKTRGWEKESDRLSVVQIQRGTGISSENTVRKWLGWLLEQGMILEVDTYSSPDQCPCEYALNPDCEITVARPRASRKKSGRDPSIFEGGATANSEGGAGSEIEGHNNHPKQQPSVNNNDGARTARISSDEADRRPTEREHRERVEGWLASDPLGDELAELMERVASKNNSGRMTWARKWNGHIAKIEEWRRLHPEAAVRYAVEECNRMGKADLRYAGGVLRNNANGPPAPARNGGNGHRIRQRSGTLVGLPGGKAASQDYDEAAY